MMSGIDKILGLAKNARKQKHLSMAYEKKYAFVGMGSHSIDNLYPVLNYLRVPLKYIVTKSEKNAQTINCNFDPVIGTNDLYNVLDDPEIEGVFLCADPKEHFNLCKKILIAQKSLFVEKPPCYKSEELAELISLQNSSNKISLVGLQRRYSPSYSLLKNKLDKPTSYSLKYTTGPYPEGDSLVELFIHPIDLAAFLFGPASIESVVSTRPNKGSITILVHLTHGDTIGALELSSDSTWSRASEQLYVNTPKRIYHSTNAETLTFEDKKGTILSIPKEKVFGHTPTATHLFHRNSFLPQWQHNSLYASGFYDEISSFVDLCENNQGLNKSTFSNLTETYRIIDFIREKINHVQQG